MCHFVTKICDKIMTKKEVQAENCAAAAEVRRPYLSRHIKLKKKKILITTTTTIILYYLVSDIWQKMQKTSTVSPHKNIVQNICV